jgi:hypothetical protein
MVTKHTDYNGHGIWEHRHHTEVMGTLTYKKYDWGRDTTGYECCNSNNK